MNREDIENLIDQKIDENSAQNQFAVSTVPFHTHNGSDSQRIPFKGLSDTPNSYYQQAGKVATVNSTETGLEFTTVIVAPGGSDTQVQFNHAGVFAGNANFTFDPSTSTLTLASGSLAVFNGKLKLPVGTNLYP